ncbi:MAG: hypothetical protein OEY00_11435 [Gammaproteobacteria bacterium]|nr:hypothetical protein [Gammaproteobacteria bacterium]MDH5802841.1 hypothetical protein [Gammaproteobacteria bacterium]
MEASDESQSLTICINKLKRVRQGLLSGQCVQPTSLLPIRRYIKDKEAQQRVGLYILEMVVSDVEFNQLSTPEQQSVKILLEACKTYSVDQTPKHKLAVKSANAAIAALQPGWKRVWIHATRRRVNHHLFLTAELCGSIFIDDLSIKDWLYEASVAYVFGYRKYRYTIEQSSINRLSGIIDFLVFDFN